jgi:hypothetical protein
MSKMKNATRIFKRLTDRWLNAGGNWNTGSNAGSRYRNANNYRWNTNTNIGRQFAADPDFRAKLLAGFVSLVSGLTGGKIHNGGARGLVAPCESHLVHIL